MTGDIKNRNLDEYLFKKKAKEETGEEIILNQHFK